MKFTLIDSSKKKLKAIIVLVLLVSNQLVLAQERSPWCFTKPMNNVPGFEPSTGSGLNWGFIPKQTQMVRTTYNIKLMTSERDGSETNSKIYIKLFGTQGASEMTLLSSGTLEVGSIFDGQVISQKDLGTIYKLKLHLIGERCYRPYKIKIDKGLGYENSFESLRQLCPCKQGGDPTMCQDEIKEEGNVTYTVEVKTRDDDSSSYHGPIHIFLRGSKGNSDEKIWNEHGAERSSDIVMNILTKDIGDVEGYRFLLKAPGTWKPGLVIIKPTITDMEKIFPVDPKNVLSFPGKPAYDENYNNSGTKLRKYAENPFEGQPIFGENNNNYPNNYHVSKPNGGGFFGDDVANDYKRENLLKHPQTSGDDGGRTQVGSLTDPEEKKQIIELTCEQNLINPSPENQIWGANYAEGNANFNTRIVKCPLNCDKATAAVFGVGFHPAQTPVCLAGIIDKAISLSGGLMAVNIYPAVTKYIPPEGWKLIGHIPIEPFRQPTEKSFSLTKIDNIDMVEKDIRIVDGNGNISNEGRVEFRYDGNWGSLCYQGLNDHAAERICKDLDYITGEWKNPKDKSSDGFCRTFKGQNYCGSDYSRVFFSQMTCQRHDKSVNDCNKIFASPKDCPHQFDAIINCINDDRSAKAMTGDDVVKPFTVRMKSNRKIDGEEIGAMELFIKQQWATVCDVDFSNESAQVACKQMGYNTGRWYTSDDASNFKASSNPDEQSAAQEFSASKLECNGTEANLRNCSAQTDGIKCSHDRDVVIACMGDDGDPTGQSQIFPKVVSPPPELGRLGLPNYSIQCDITFQKRKYFRGDPGSIYIIECPPGCHKVRGAVVGTGIYASDSNVCKSACHAGVIPCENGGNFVITKTFSQGYYEATNSNGIISSQREGDDSLVSFTFSKKFSNHQAYNNILKSKSLSTVNHSTQTLKSFYEKLLDKASQGLSNLLSTNNGKPEEMYSNHSTQQPTLSANFNVGEGSAKINVNMGNKGPSISGSLSYTSFIELKNNFTSGSAFGNVAFKWVESVGTHRFDEFGKVFINSNAIKTLEKQYTIFMAFTLQEFRFDDAYILSYSGCQGFNIWINFQSVLMLGDPCDQKYQLNTGWKIPVGVKTILYVYSARNKVSLKLRIVKDPNHYEQFQKIRLTIPEKDKLCIGCKATEISKFFVGDIDFIIIYDSYVPHNLVKNVIDEIDNQKKAQDNTNDFPTTNDGRKCLTNPTTDPTPNQPGAPTPPEESRQKRPDEGADPSSVEDGSPEIKEDPSDINHSHPRHDNFLENKANGFFSKVGDTIAGWLGFKKKKPKHQPKLERGPPTPPPPTEEGEEPADSTMNKEDEGNLSSVRLECDDTGKDIRFANQKGKIFRITCGSCWNAKYPVFGSGIYHPNSSICKAALHSGVLQKGEKGDIILEIGQGYQAFNGESGLGGVKSVNAGGDTYSLMIRKAPALRKISCTTSATESEFGTAAKDTKFLVVCPKHCSKAKKNVYGSGTYSEPSPICMSAFHDGIIGEQGGNVQFIISEGQSEYKGTQGFSIKSLPQGPQLRSFTFLGNKSSIYHNFKETCEGKLNKHWKQIDDKNTRYKNENDWSFYKNPNFMSTGKKSEPIKTIMHVGKIQNKVKGITYASVLKYSYLGAEWANGMIRVNIMFFGKEGKTGIMFRYNDNDNHYGIMFDLEDPNNNLKLYKKSEGSVDIISGKYIDISLSTWYRVSIYLDYNNIKITLQVGEIRQHKEVFNKNIQGIQRGTLAFGVDYMRKIFFMGVEVSNWVPDNIKNELNKKNRCIIDKIQNSLHLEKRKWQCKKMFRGNPSEMIRCLEPHVYCKLKCDEHISPIEALSNYCCFSGCVQAIKNLNKSGINTDSSWTPSINEKVDYLQRGENGYIAAIVTGVSDDQDYGEGNKLVSLNFVTPDGTEQTTVQERWKPHSKQIVKCGQELIDRKDCGSVRHFG